MLLYLDKFRCLCLVSCHLFNYHYILYYFRESISEKGIILINLYSLSIAYRVLPLALVEVTCLIKHSTLTIYLICLSISFIKISIRKKLFSISFSILTLFRKISTSSSHYIIHNKLICLHINKAL